MEGGWYWDVVGLDAMAVLCDKGGQEILRTDCYDAPEGPHKALIAAAPELLEALEILVERVEESSIEYPVFATKQARAAIDKARQKEEV